MIDHVHGTVTDIYSDRLVVQTQGGVGYELYMPAPRLDLNGSDRITIWVLESISANDHRLYGFLDRFSRNLARLLTGADDCGPSTAAGFVHEHGVSGLIHLTKSPPAKGVRIRKALSFLSERLTGKHRDQLVAELGLQSRDQTIPVTVESLTRHGHAQAAQILKSMGFVDTDVSSFQGTAYEIVKGYLHRVSGA